VRFLIDECLSVDLVNVAGESGHEAQHVAHVGRAGWKDWNVRYARERFCPVSAILCKTLLDLQHEG
jgi:predicted nuclease of predicted toxin-antitoxin system